LKIFGWLADNQGCGHYRLILPLRELAVRGHETLAHQTMPRDWAETADVIVAQRTCLGPPSWLWNKLANEGRAKLVYEIDDNLFDLDPGNPALELFGDPTVVVNMRHNIEISHLVTVSTPALAEVIAQINPNVVVLPNCIDRGLFNFTQPAPRNEPPLLGWQGSPTHGADFAEITKPLAQVLRADPGLRFRFVGYPYPDGLPLMQLQYQPWTLDMEEHYRRIAQFDIAVAPLRPSPFNRSKSNLRLLESMALGIPYVASDLPEYAGVTVPGETGFVARREHEWVKHLRELANNRDLRQSISRLGPAHAEKWVIQQRVTAWEDAYLTL